MRKQSEIKNEKNINKFSKLKKKIKSTVFLKVSTDFLKIIAHLKKYITDKRRHFKYQIKQRTF